MRRLMPMSLIPAVFLFASCSQSDPVAKSSASAQSAPVQPATAATPDSHHTTHDSHATHDSHPAANSQHEHGAAAASEKSHHGHPPQGAKANGEEQRSHDGEHRAAANDHKHDQSAKHNQTEVAHAGKRAGSPKHGHQANDSHAAGKKSDAPQHAAQPKDQPSRDKPPADAPPAKGEAVPVTEDLESLPALEIFNRRILPIMKADDSSSCADCHLSGVDLKNYILDDQARTFASLRDHGLINVNAPDKSKLLTFISRTPDKPSPVSDKVRQQEFRAFRAWIVAAVKDPELLKTKAAAEADFPTNLPIEVIRHARTDRVLASFVDNVWSQMGRCISCHSPDRNQKVVEKHGKRVSWIVPRDPAATLDNLVRAGNIDLDDPEESLMLLKPAGLADHGGGPKFLVGDTAYHQFLTFAKDYAAMRKAQYKTAADLPQPPAEITRLTNQHLRITGVPERFNKLPLKVVLYRWDAETNAWSKDRWATAFGPVNGKQSMWQNMMTATSPRESPRAATVRREDSLLPAGRYLAKLYLDRDGQVANDPDFKLSDREFVGQIELNGDWPPGYQPPKIVEFPRGDARTN